LAVLFLIEVTRSSYGQVVLDGKFGTSGAVAGPNFDLNSGMGAVRGNNLFHSFSQFDLKAGDVATFSGPANVQNILSRVTGGNPSSINGTIRSSIAGANFFLINPKGVMFGPKAAVNVTGSFAASTADYLKLADGARFMAALDADDSGLSTAPVSDFGFLGNTPGSIATEQSTLRGANGRTLSLVGGDISLSGGAVSSPAGRLDVVSVQSAGEVPVDPKTMTKSEFRAAFPQQGQVILQNGALADATGSGGGRVVIRGGRLTADNARIQANTTGTTAGQGIDIAVVHDLNLLNGGQINSLSPAGRGASGNIQVSAESIRLDGGGLVDASFNPKTQISTASGDLASGGGAAKGGDIVIQTGSLELVNSAQISSATYGAGNAGRIEIEASSVRLDALLTTPTQIVANSQRSTSVGNAGDILIRTESLDLVNGATILAASFGSGRAGLLDIKAESVNIFSGAIMTAGTFGSGSGGNVQITCESLRIDGRDILTGGQDFLTGIQAVTTSLFSPAPGGSIHVSADSLELANSASIFTSSYGIGPGGDIAITAGNLTLDHDSTIRASGEGAGRAGKISIFSSRDVVLTDKSAISTSAPQSSGGDIQLQAGNEIQLFNSQVTAQAGPGGGGNITLLAPSLIYMLDSTLTAQAVGDGGNLNIDPIFFILNRSSLVSKSSSANGGNITILSDYFLQSSSVIDASAPFGLPGTVSVSAPDVDLSGSLIGLPGSLLGAETQLRPDCGVRLAESISSFIVLGRGGLPFEPGGFVPSGLVSLWDEDQ
jgi:filamentous hemagglutinin family protein